MQDPINILIVDDEPKNLTVLETVLDDPAYRLVRAESADKALLALVAEEFALLILDIRMPGMTGFELAQMIKERKKTADVPIIFLSAYYNEDQHVLEGYDSGAVDYVHKPVNPSILRSKVAVFAELYRKSRESSLANRALLVEVTERRRVEEQLRKLNATLEQRVSERTRALTTAAKALQQSLKDKEALLMEVHHRVKNNLQVISSLLRMEAHRSQQADTKAVLTDMQGRIRSMALLHKALYRSGTFASVELGSYLQQVASQAFAVQSPSQSQSADLVRLTLRLGSVQVGMDQAISAGLLVNELISNCLKHAFPQQRAGEVSVELQLVDAQAQAGDPQWRLCVSDTGVGLPPDFDLRRKTSLGLQLADDLGQQIGGSLMIESQPGQGAQFTLIFTALAPQSLVMPL